MNNTNPLGAKVIPLRRDSHENAAGVAVRWLVDRHRKAWRTAFESLLDRLHPETGIEDSPQLDADFAESLSINAGEWLIARGEMLVKGQMRSINAHLLGRDGPYLTPAQQDWIAQLGKHPLRLYRVTDVRPGSGLTLVDALDAEADALDVQERSGSATAKPGMLLGARVMHLADHRELSGAVYPFAALRESSVLAQVRAALAADLDPANTLQLAEFAIARCWLAQWLQPLPMPELRDASTGEPMLLITDHYRVIDPAALAGVLATQADVTGNAQQGWHRDSDAGDGMRRSLVAINPGRSADRIALFYRTQGLADAGRAWFDALAGAAVQHLTRELTDPRSTAVADSAAPQEDTADEIAPEHMTALMTQVLHKHYANWADEPIPVLGNKTPRRAVATPAGLERVKGLLRSYESGEADMARADRRAPVSYQFLWDALGIAR